MGVGLSGLRVLVVEDSFLMADALCDLLAEYGMVPVGPVASVNDALDRLAAGAVDAAVIDVRLQRGTSLALCQSLHRRGLPFVFLTGDSHGVVPAAFAGVPVVSKPCSPEALVAALRTVVGRAAIL